MRLAAFGLLACTGFVQGPPKERTGVVTVDCTDSYAPPAIDAGLWIATSTSTIVAWKTSDALTDECGGIGCFVLPMATAMTIILPLVAAHGFERVHACRETKARVAHHARIEELRNARERAHEYAWTLTKQAATAARDGNCELVRETSAKVRAEDADFHATVFVRDVAIARCL